MQEYGIPSDEAYISEEADYKFLGLMTPQRRIREAFSLSDDLEQSCDLELECDNIWKAVHDLARLGEGEAEAGG